MLKATLESEKALSATDQANAQSQAVKPKASYTSKGSGVKKGFEWLFIYPVDPRFKSSCAHQISTTACAGLLAGPSMEKFLLKSTIGAEAHC